MSTDYRADAPDWPWSAVITTADGKARDVTRELAVMYDAIIGSMDWGSGFLDREDVEALFRIGTLCGFKEEEYPTRRSGPSGVVLLDRDGNALSDAKVWASSPRFGGYERDNGYVDITLTPAGEKVSIRDVHVAREGVVESVRTHATSHGPVTYSLPEPLPVEAGNVVALSFILPRADVEAVS